MRFCDVSVSLHHCLRLAGGQTWNATPYAWSPRKMYRRVYRPFTTHVRAFACNSDDSTRYSGCNSQQVQVRLSFMVCIAVLSVQSAVRLPQ